MSPEIDALALENVWAGSCCGLTARLGVGETLILSGARDDGARTLTRLILGMEPLERGAIRVFGDDVAEMEPEDLLAMRTFFGVVPEQGMLISNLSVFDNVALSLRYHDVHPEDEVVEIVREALDGHGLANLGSHRPADLTTAQRRLVGLVRAVVINPRVLLVDDLYEGLEEDGFEQVTAILGERIGDGCAVLLTTRRNRLEHSFDGALLRLPNHRVVAWPQPEAVPW